MVQVAVLSANGEGRTLKTSAEVSPAGMAKALRKSKHATAVGTYEWNDATLTVWGWMEGKVGTENKHALPAPYDEIELFGDMIVSSSDGDFTIDDWKKFCEDGDDEEEVEEDADADADEIEEDAEEAEADEADAEEVVDEEVEEVADEEVVEEEEAVEEEEDENEGCYEDGEDNGGAKRRAPRRRNLVSPEYRRIDMGMRSRIKLPLPPGKRAPRWQTAPELEPEEYTD